MILTEVDKNSLMDLYLNRDYSGWDLIDCVEKTILNKLQDKLNNAERYEWLRNKVAVSNDSISGAYCWMPSCNYKLNTNDKSETDKAIDSAIAKERN